jgi:hypothetical protein
MSLLGSIFSMNIPEHAVISCGLAMHKAPDNCHLMSQTHSYGCTGDLGTTRCNSNVLLLLHAIDSERCGRYAGFICRTMESM